MRKKKHFTDLELGAASLSWFFGLHTHVAAVSSTDSMKLNTAGKDLHTDRHSCIGFSSNKLMSNLLVFLSNSFFSVYQSNLLQFFPSIFSDWTRLQNEQQFSQASFHFIMDLLDLLHHDILPYAPLTIKNRLQSNYSQHCSVYKKWFKIKVPFQKWIQLHNEKTTIFSYFWWVSCNFR